MNSFRFRLEKLHELRLAEEKANAAKVGVARTRMANALEKAIEFRAAEVKVRDRMTQAIGNGPSVGALQNLRVLLNHVGRQRQVADAEHRAREKELEETLAVFRGSIRERKILDRLREKKRETWQADQRREEQELLDELSGRDRSILGREKMGAS